VEESFIARLRKGDHFLFGGRVLEFVRLHEMTAYVRRSTAGSGPSALAGRPHAGPRPGARRRWTRLQLAEQRQFDGPEMQAVQPLLALQDAGRRCRPGSTWWSKPSRAAKAIICSSIPSPAGWCTGAGLAAGLAPGQHARGDLLDCRQRLWFRIAGAEEVEMQRLAPQQAPQSLFSKTSCWKMSWPA
jgi:ATP-dependent Lhr-like helicase